ncbi:MAG: response regulator [Spirochaetes bacterium]|nr:response regulator [Spirochaetota bacterium]MBU1080197.1 response regulator [Spirochaetota bacterium]
MDNKVKKAVILVDDEILLIMTLRMEMQRHYGDAFRVETATRAERAEALLTELIDSGVMVVLIISDWSMPGMRGDALLERIRSKDGTIKTILLSGYACDDSVRRLYDSNCLDAFVAKPWTEETLFGTVDRLLSAG